MKKKFLYIWIVAGMISLCGCGSASVIDGKEDRDVMDFYETEEAQETSTDMSAQEESRTVEVDRTMIGRYIPQGYENDYLGYRVDLPDDLTLLDRGVITSIDVDDIIVKANDPSTIDPLYNQMLMGRADVFKAVSERGYMCVGVETRGPDLDEWDEEEILAARAEDSKVEFLQDIDAQITEIRTEPGYLDGFLGEGHYAVSASYQRDGEQKYEMDIFVRSADKKYLSKFEFTADSEEDLVRMVGCCSAMTETPAQENGARELEYPAVGIYIPQGYENAYLGYRIDLPEDLRLKRRSMFDYEIDEEDIIEEANSATTTDYMNYKMGDGGAEVFGADSEREYIGVVVERSGESGGYQDEEEVLAAEAVKDIVEALRSHEDATTEITQIDTEIEYLDDFLGEGHYAVSYTYQVNGMSFYGREVIVRSVDRQYVSYFSLMARSTEELEQMTGCCTAM